MELKRQNWHQCDIAQALGIRAETVSRWLARARDGGLETLRAHPPPGHPPRLSPDQKRPIPEFLWHGPEAYGFRGQVWTCARIALVIEEEFGVRYHKGHVGQLLKELRWTPQVPIRRAIPRDEQAIRRWRVEVWPELLRQAKRERRVLVFEDESGFSLLPGLVRTYAPKGQTPVIREVQTRDHLSVMGGMTPQGSRSPPTEASPGPGLLCAGRLDPRENLIMFARRSVTAVAVFIVVPLVVGVIARTLLIRARGKDWFEKSFLPRFQPVAVTALLGTLLLIFAFQANNILNNPLHVGLIAVPILIQVYFNSSLTYGLMWLLRVPHNVAAPGALIGASNFFELAVATAIALYGPGSGAALATVVGVLVEVPVMLSVCAACNRTRSWFAPATS